MDQSTEGDDKDGPSADSSREGTSDGFHDGSQSPPTASCRNPGTPTTAYDYNLPSEDSSMDGTLMGSDAENQSPAEDHASPATPTSYVDEIGSIGDHSTGHNDVHPAPTSAFQRPHMTHLGSYIHHEQPTAGVRAVSCLYRDTKAGPHPLW